MVIFKVRIQSSLHNSYIRVPIKRLLKCKDLTKSIFEKFLFKNSKKALHV